MNDRTNAALIEGREGEPARVVFRYERDGAPVPLTAARFQVRAEDGALVLAAGSDGTGITLAPGEVTVITGETVPAAGRYVWGLEVTEAGGVPIEVASGVFIARGRVVR